VAFEKHRFIRQPLQFDVLYECSIQPRLVKIPSMIIQPFVENAIWHGLLPKNGGRVWLHIIDGDAGYVLVEIHDDGMGLQPVQSHTTGNGVRGIQLIRERITAYNQLHKHPIKLFIPEPVQSGAEGFFVQLAFPLKPDPV
jgi:sensor histidine kinase YesM